MAKKLRIIFSVIASVCAAGLVVGSMRGTEIWLARKYTPPVGANRKSLDEWCPRRTGEVEVLVDGAIVYVVFGPHPLFPITEFPPGYVFDDAGKLIAWSPEASNTDEYSKYWDTALDALIEEDRQQHHK